jgi:hypothetical protein
MQTHLQHVCLLQKNEEGGQNVCSKINVDQNEVLGLPQSFPQRTARSVIKRNPAQIRTNQKIDLPVSELS